MVPNQSSSMISTLSVLLPVLGVVTYLLAMPKVRQAAKDHLERAHAYFFHESERTPPPALVQETTAPVKASSSPLGQIEPAGWDYKIYELADQDPSTPA